MAPKLRKQGRVDSDIPDASPLCRLLDALACFTIASGDDDELPRQVNLVPFQGDDLAPPHARIHRQKVKEIDPPILVFMFLIRVRQEPVGFLNAQVIK